MKYYVKLFFGITVLLIFGTWQSFAQTDGNSGALVRTPESEAMRQTERMKTDLALTPTQEKLVYNINLKYEKERQQSNDRKKALERVRNKNEELRKVLTEQQYSQLQRKRYDQSTLHRQSRNENESEKNENQTNE
jgi:hypothetical protein